MKIKENPIRQKSYHFALSIVQFCKKLQQQKEFVLQKQLMKSGTSIGANIEEALQGFSKNDFIAKLSIALKESCETDYWLRLIRDSQISTPEEIEPLREKVHELTRMLTSIIKTSRANL